MSITNTSLTSSMPSELLAEHKETPLTTKTFYNQESLDALLQRTGYPMVQENGQRRYGPPPDWDTSKPEPDRGCEVFVGKIPRDCFEDELVPVLERIGYVYEFRLMMEYSGYNRGYGFVMYTSRENAKKAVSVLNNYEIRKGRMIGLCRSVDNCRLFVGGIPKNKKKEEILEEMKKVTDDVINVIVYPSANDKTKNRGFAFVQYGSHRAAAVARRKLIPNRISLFGQPIAVDWAEPEPEVDEDVMAAVKVLYVRNLMLTTTEEKIRFEFEKIKENSVERVKKMKDFAFVHFKEREDALNAMNLMNGSTIDDAIVEVTLSKPIDKTNILKLQPNLAANHLIVSTLDNDLNLLLSAGAPMASHLIHHPQSNTNQLINIPIAFTDPNLQYHLSNHAMQAHSITPIPMSPLTQTQINIPNFSQFSHPMLTSQNQFIPNIATFNPNDFNGLLPSYQQQLVNTATTTATNSNKLAPNRNVLRSSPTARVSNGVHRSTYYNAVKNGAALVAAGRKQPTSDDLLYDYYSGIKPVPLLPLNMQAFKYNSKSSVEALEELCIKEGIPTPIYTLHTTSGYEPDGKEIGLFMYKVMIPNIFNATQLSSNRLMRSIDEAKNDAAEFVLTQIYSNPMQHQIQQSTLIPNELKNEQLTTPVTAVYQPNHQIQTVLNAANEPKSQTSAQSSINPNNGQYQDLSEYQPLLAPQPYIFDPTGQFLMCQTSE